MYEDKNPDSSERPRPTKITTCYFLITAYAASMGGCGTLIGTGTNMTFKNMYSEAFPGAPEVDFARFMAYSATIMLVYTALSWVWLQFLFMGMFRPNSTDAKEGNIGIEGERITHGIIKEKYAALGPMRSHEIWVSFLFLMALVLWFFRSPGFIQGWAKQLTGLKVDDSTPAMLVVVLMFILPAKWTWLDWFSSNKEGK